jgi:glycosyltransferase involved in cell wall biosynthesis
LPASFGSSAFQSDATTRPEVSIGLPVYNGERYLAGGIASILDQTYRKFELIICDNASTDATPAICRGFAANEERIRYYRQPHNLGAAANFNHCVDLASGKYFKWAADDDLLEPRFLELCVMALEDDPGAVLAQSLVKVVDEDDRLIEIYDHSARGTRSARPSERLAGRLPAPCMEIFGVIRTEALRDSHLIGSYTGSDRGLLIELALRGRFALVPEPLFINRDHPGRCTRLVKAQGDRSHLLPWYDTQKNARQVFSTWKFYATCFRLVRRYVQSPGERMRCYGHLVRSLGARRRAVYLVLEPLMALDPRALQLARSIKRGFRRARQYGRRALPWSA